MVLGINTLKRTVTGKKRDPPLDVAPLDEGVMRTEKAGTFHIELPEDHQDEDAHCKGDWYHSTFHTVTAMVGAGVLGLPFAMGFLGWFWGTLLLVYACAVSLYTSWQLVVCHEIDGVRMSRYLQLGRYAFGKTWGSAIIIPAQIAVLVGTSITYVIVAGKSLNKAEELIGESDLSLRTWMLLFGVVSLVVVQLPDFHSLWWVSLLGGAMSLGYCVVATIGCFIVGPVPGVSYGPPGGGFTGADLVFGGFRAVGDIIFAFGGHSVLLAIQATIKRPSEGRMMAGVYWAYIVVAANSFSVAMAGYWALGSPQAGPGFEDDLLAALSRPNWMILSANLMVGIHMIAGYQVFSFTMIGQIEDAMEARHKARLAASVPLADKAESQQKIANLPSVPWWHKSLMRCTYVAFTTIAAMLIPFFGDLMSFIGALGVTPLTFVLPSVIYLVVWKNQVKRWEVIVSWIIIVTFTAMGAVAAIGALRNLVVAGDFTWDVFSDVNLNGAAATTR